MHRGKKGRQRSKGEQKYKIKSFQKLLTTTSNSIKHKKNITRKHFLQKDRPPTNNFGIKIIDPRRVF
jgi:hypothetical protein